MNVATALSVLVLTAFPAAAHVGGRVAAWPEEQPRLSGLAARPQIVERHRLTPAAGSDHGFESFVVEVLDDGTRLVRGTQRLDDRGDRSRYRWTADLNAGTYRVERTPLAAERRFDDAETDDLDSAPNNCEDPANQPCADRCSGSWTATVTNEDPAFIDISQTTVNGSWAVYGMTTCLWRESYSGSCWANPLSPINTTWFVDSCTRSGSTVTGAFHNDDWRNDDLPTYAVSTVTIRRVDGLGTFIDWASRFSGEDHFLLNGSLTQSGSNTCF